VGHFADLREELLCEPRLAGRARDAKTPKFFEARVQRVSIREPERRSQRIDLVAELHELADFVRYQTRAIAAYGALGSIVLTEQPPSAACARMKRHDEALPKSLFEMLELAFSLFAPARTAHATIAPTRRTTTTASLEFPNRPRSSRWSMRACQYGLPAL
jgi:hypothetical protein